MQKFSLMKRFWRFMLQTTDLCRLIFKLLPPVTRVLWNIYLIAYTLQKIIDKNNTAQKSFQVFIVMSTRLRLNWSQKTNRTLRCSSSTFVQFVLFLASTQNSYKIDSFKQRDCSLELQVLQKLSSIFKAFIQKQSKKTLENYQQQCFGIFVH